MRRSPDRRIGILLVLVVSTFVLGTTRDARSQEKVDAEVVKWLREQGLEKSQVMETLSWICDVHGPRLTASPNLRRACEWAKETFTGWGLRNARLEAWGPFGRGWRLDRVAVHVTGDNPWPVLAWPKAWSPGLPGRVEAEVVLAGGKTKEEVEALDLKGRIVLLETPREVTEPFEGPAKRLDAQELLDMANGATDAAGPGGPQRRDRGEFMRGGSLLRTVWDKQPLAILDRGFKGDYGTLFVASASIPGGEGADFASRPRPWDPAAGKVIPQFTLSVEHYNRLCRLAQKGIPVRMALELETSFDAEASSPSNVLAEIPGADPAIGSQVVMFGAHFDSWHSGTGTTDNGCGSAVVMEAARLLAAMVKETGRAPRRTLRAALWSGEEQGLLGSRAWVREHLAVPGERGQPPVEIKPDHAHLAAYFNLDNGTGKVRGVYLQGNEAVAPVFRAWLEPFHDLGAATLTLNNTGGTDHLSFDAVGLPGFQFIQDPAAYSPRTHHSNMDLWDHAIADDLKQAATIMAAFAWHAAQRDEMLPRKPFRAAAGANSR